MADRQIKSAIIRWLIPAVILIIILAVMLFDFSTKSRQAADNNVAETFLNTAEKYAEEVNYEIKAMTAAGKTVMQLICGETWISEKKILTMEEALCNNSDACEVMFCRGEGLGLLHDGKKVETDNITYFPEIKEELKRMAEERKTADEPLIYYTYVFNDEIGTGNPAVIAAIAGSSQEDMLLMYYPVEKLDALFVQPRFGIHAFFAVFSPEGEIIKVSGAGNLLAEGGNIWDVINNGNQNKELMQKNIIRMKNNTSGSFSVNVGGFDRKMVYAPVGINNWTLLIGIEQSYVDEKIEEEWSNSEQMIRRLIIAIGVFLGMVIVFNIIGRIRNNEKRRRLEEKADTDLLTGLNNKLATERKVKEHMEKHPKEQALLFVFDVDDFKKINDTLGHAFGDEVLSSLGHQVKTIFRSSDIAGRIGGDEFMILLKKLDSDEIIEKEAMKLCNFFKNFQVGEYVKYAPTASIGAAVFPKDGNDFDSLYKAADKALYTAKRRGKSQLAFYGEESDKSEGKKKVERDGRVFR